jgi:hypothetical protein
MAWTAPRTWVSGELVTAALFNTHIKDNQTFLKDNQDNLIDGTAVIPMTTLDGTATASAPAVAPAGDSRTYFDSDLDTFLVSRDGGAYRRFIPCLLNSRSGTPFAGTGANTTKTKIWSAIVPAGIMQTDGDVLEFSMGGITDGSAEPHQLFVAWSGSDRFTTADVNLGGASWVMRGTIVRLHATYGMMMIHYEQSSANDNIRCKIETVPTTWSSAQTLELWAQNGAAVANGIDVRVAKLTYLPCAFPTAAPS